MLSLFTNWCFIKTDDVLLNSFSFCGDDKKILYLTMMFVIKTINLHELLTEICEVWELETEGVAPAGKRR